MFHFTVHQVAGIDDGAYYAHRQSVDKVLLYMGDPTGDRIHQRLQGQPWSWNAELRFDSNGKE
jgi:hypothetical protein